MQETNLVPPIRAFLSETVVSNAAQANSMTKILLPLICSALLMACTPSPSVDVSTASVKQYVSAKTKTEIQVFVESQRDVDGDFNNLQRELKVSFMLLDSSAATEMTLPNGLVLKRGIRSDAVIALVVHAKDAQSWKVTKVELLKMAK